MGPELAQSVDTRLRRVTGDDGGIDRSDRDAGNPVGMNIGFGQGLVDPRLIGAKRAAPLQKQGDAVERQSPLRG